MHSYAGSVALGISNDNRVNQRHSRWRRLGVALAYEGEGGSGLCELGRHVRVGYGEDVAAPHALKVQSAQKIVHL